jgi:hypothetical protein
MISEGRWHNDSAKVDCVDVNDFFSSSNSKDFSFFPQSVQFRDAGNLLGLWVFVSFVFGLGFLVELVIGALGEFLVMGFIFWVVFGIVLSGVSPFWSFLGLG